MNPSRDLCNRAGLAPEKPEVRSKREAAIGLLVQHLEDETPPLGECITAIAEAISEARGLFNRTHRQDQWDWFLVWSLLGRLPAWLAKKIAADLQAWRRAILDDDAEAVAEARTKLIQCGTVRLLRGYLDGRTDWKGGVVYILSRRTDPTILKIGFTTRDPIVRAAEINAATGVLEPLGVRAAWAVNEAATTEREIHALLAAHRLRDDREFFEIEFRDAFARIGEHLRNRRAIDSTSLSE